MRNVLVSLMLVSSMAVGCDEAPAPVEQEGHEATSVESQIDDTPGEGSAVVPPAAPDPAVQAVPRAQAAATPEPAATPTPAPTEVAPAAAPAATPAAP